MMLLSKNKWVQLSSSPSSWVWVSWYGLKAEGDEDVFALFFSTEGTSSTTSSTRAGLQPPPHAAAGNAVGHKGKRTNGNDLDWSEGQSGPVPHQCGLMVTINADSHQPQRAHQGHLGVT